MRYYVYISDAKVEMLAAQVPSKLLRRTAKDLRIDFKVLSVSLHQDPSEETRYSKLQVVLRALEEAESIGTVDVSGSWFRGSEPLAWGHVGPHGEVVYFTGVVGEKLLGLTGSSRHVLGGQPSSYVDTDRERYAPGGSWARHMVESALSQDLSVTEGGQSDEAFQKGDGAAITAMLGLHRRLVGHREPVEFVAKRLLELPAEAVDLDAGLAGTDLPAFEGILLGTPLYVAMAD